MTPDEMAAKTEPADVDNLLEEQLRATLKDLQRASLQPKPVEDLHGSEDVQSLLSRHLDQDSSERRAIYNRLQTIEGAIKRRRSRGIARYLIAIGIGVAATLGSPAKKAANSAALPTEKADTKKSTHHKSGAGFNGGY